MKEQSIRRLGEASTDESRREFLGRVGAVGAASLIGETLLPAAALAQAKPEPQVPGTIANPAVLAEKVKQFQVHSERPLTGSVPAHLHDFDVTPTDRMFVRNNLLTPDIAAATHRLTVKGLVDKELVFSLEDLGKSFEVVTMQGMLECAGSGRAAYVPAASGTRWLETGGMGCPKWTGVRLRDVLRAAGVRPNAAHLAGQGGDPGAVPTAPPVIRSIPLAKAMEENTLLAWDMNGAALPKVHGHPLRLVVPGWVGSASTKWLHTLTVLDAPFKGTFMTSSYIMPKFSIRPGDRMPPDIVSTEAWPVKSMITYPSPGASFKGAETIEVRGRAWVGEGRVTRVEISVDEGASWQRADLGPRADRYAWRKFTFRYQPQRFGYLTFLARATDERGNTQPAVPYWNPLGYFWNGWHRVGVLVAPA